MTAVRKLPAVLGLLVAALVPAAVTTVVTAAPAHAVAGITGKVLVPSVSAYNSTTTKAHQATCPTGKVVISGGAFVEGPTTVRLVTTRPIPTARAWQAEAINFAGRAPWSLHVYAVCADQPPGLAYITSSSVPVSPGVRYATARCPDGRQAIGLGGRAALEPGRNVGLSYVTPAGAVTSAFAFSAEAQGGEPDPWTTVAYLVCAFPVGATIVQEVGPSSSTAGQVLSVSCAPGTLLAAGGAVQAGSQVDHGQLGLLALYPDGSLTTSVVLANEDVDGYPKNWNLRAFALCG